MKIRIETYFSNDYKTLFEEYGVILCNYELQNVDGMAYICLNSFDDLFKLHHEIEKWQNEKNFTPFFGILTQQDSGTGEYYLEIKDNWD